MQAERDSLHAQLLSAMDQTAKWERKEAALEGQLAEVRGDSYDGDEEIDSNKNIDRDNNRGGDRNRDIDGNRIT